MALPLRYLSRPSFRNKLQTMTLDELIAQMTNPQDFTRLCNSVFTDIYGDAFQVIDGTRGDNGNDGYVASEKRMLAMHCPVKPEQKTDVGYLKKIKGDLAKAVALRNEQKYAIETWTFITPRKLSNDVIATMRAIGDEVKIRATHQESTFLANELYKREHLLSGFPGLQQLNLGAKIEQLTAALAAKQSAQTAAEKKEHAQEPPVCDEVGDARLHELAAGTPTQEAKSELKAIAYRTTDPILEINVILTLFRWFSPVDDDRSELIAFADRGVRRARLSRLADAEALLRANKAAMLILDFNTIFVETYVTNMADMFVSFAITPIEQKQQRLATLRNLEDAWKSEVAAAMDLIKESSDHEAVAAVLLLLGVNMGQLAHMHRIVGQDIGADRYLAQCKALLMSAKDMYAAAGDELGATNAVFNLANQVRWHDGKKEAIDLVKSTIPVAEKHGDLLLLQKAKWLQHTLETGEIPDYVAGERRAWTDVPPAKNKG